MVASSAGPTSGCPCRTTRTWVSWRSTCGRRTAGGGIGTSLYVAAEERFREAGRTTLLGEVNVPVAAAGTAGMPFAESLGFASDHVEDHFVLELPVASETRAGPPGVAARPR